MAQSHILTWLLQPTVTFRCMSQVNAYGYAIQDRFIKAVTSSSVLFTLYSIANT